MAEKKIDPELNRERVRRSMEKHGTERLNIYLPEGTIERIRALNLEQKPGSFAKTVVLAEIEKLEKLSTKK